MAAAEKSILLRVLMPSEAKDFFEETCNPAQVVDTWMQLMSGKLRRDLGHNPLAVSARCISQQKPHVSSMSGISGRLCPIVTVSTRIRDL